MRFTGFDPHAVSLLARLPALDASQYDLHRSQLSEGLRQPGLALIQTVAQALSPELVVHPRSSVSPLHRDLRFAPEGSPRYKDHLLLTTWQGSDKKTAPTLWIRIDAERMGFASGVGFTPEVRTRWRQAIGGSAGETLAGYLETLGRTLGEHTLDLADPQVKRVPAPWPADHPRADLLRMTGFQARYSVPLPDELDAPDFAQVCIDHLTHLWPVHTWLIRALISDPAGATE